MSKKTLAKLNGIFGLTGGIILLMAPLFLVAAIGNDIMANQTTNTGLLNFITLAIKFGALVLGIMGIVSFKDEEDVSSAPSVLLIVGGGLGLIPLLGWVGGILLIIGGALNLSSIKKFDGSY